MILRHHLCELREESLPVQFLPTSRPTPPRAATRMTKAADRGANTPWNLVVAVGAGHQRHQLLEQGHRLEEQATLGLSEVTIQQEEMRQAYAGSPGCPPPPGVTIVPASVPNSAGGESVAVGTLVNGTPWIIVIYLEPGP
jgi:hypothetical protein